MATATGIDRYHTYAELTACVHGLAERFPHLCEVSSIGRSHEGREIWALQITNADTGAPGEKPGYYIDANIHAGEVTGCATALYTALYLCEQHGRDPEVTGLVDRLTWYILPRVNPDGAETYLTTPHMLRSSTRPYPYPEPQDGLHPEDVNGDGLILQMRVPDPEGEWKLSTADPRLLVPRRPNDWGGQYYRLMSEGRLQHFDGVTIKEAPPRWGLDLNRNFPAQWEPEARVKGSGPYPMSEPETRAQAEFILAHPNIFGAQAYHTTSGYLLRPSCLRPDGDLPAADLVALKAIGAVGTDITGYPCVSVYEGFTMEKNKPLQGVFFEWLYDHLGLVAYSTELWDPLVRAGLDRFPFKAHTEAEALQLLQWNDRELAGAGFVPWTPCQHPQLGPVEIGGWNVKFCLQNPPLALLAPECHKNMRFTLAHAGAAPQLGLAVQADPLGEGLYKLTAVLKNRGYLPTQVTEQAKAMQAARPLRVELALPAGAAVVLGKGSEEVDHLAGRVIKDDVPVFWWGISQQQRERKLEWILRAPPGGTVTVTARSQRAGSDGQSVTLP